MFFSLSLSLRETGNHKTSSRWKLYAAPLVTAISRNDVVTKGNLQRITKTMLSPLLKGEYNTFAAAVDQSSAISSLPCTDTSSKLINKDNSLSKSVASSNLPLQLVDESGACIDLSMGDEKSITISSSSTSVVLYLDWSQKLMETYDIYHLENLPEVFKNGPVTKKARSEPLSLYTCLEAFLQEEPLVPEDMWLVYTLILCLVLFIYFKIMMA